MTDCPNVEMREALPDLVHGTLDDGTRALVEAHLAECDPCTTELVILRAVFVTARAPRVDVARIAAAVPAYRRRSRFETHSLRIAAAVLLGAAGVSGIAIARQHMGTSGATPQVAAVAPSSNASATDSGIGTADDETSGVDDTGIALIGTAELSDAHLAKLVSAMDHLPAAPPAEPDPMLPTAMTDGGAL